MGIVLVFWEVFGWGRFLLHNCTFYIILSLFTLLYYIVWNQTDKALTWMQCLKTMQPSWVDSTGLLIQAIRNVWCWCLSSLFCSFCWDILLSSKSLALNVLSPDTYFILPADRISHGRLWPHFHYFKYACDNKRAARVWPYMFLLTTLFLLPPFSFPTQCCFVVDTVRLFIPAFTVECLSCHWSLQVRYLFADTSRSIATLQ